MAILRYLTDYYVEESVKLFCVVPISRIGSFWRARSGGEFSWEAESGSVKRAFRGKKRLLKDFNSSPPSVSFMIFCLSLSSCVFLNSVL